MRPRTSRRGRPRPARTTAIRAPATCSYSVNLPLPGPSRAHGSFLAPGNLAWFPPLRLAVRPVPPHRVNALYSVSSDGLGAVTFHGADLGRLSAGQDVRSHRGCA